jgi:hypothetical protein
LNMFMQGNSRFGARFDHGDMTGRVEFGGSGNIRLLYARYDMGGYYLKVGQDYTGIYHTSRQVYGSDNGFAGWGAADESRQPQITAEFHNGFYASLLRPVTLDASGHSQGKNILLPKFNFGYKTLFSDNMNFHGSFGLNHYTYDENDGTLDEAVLAYIIAMTLGIDMDPMMFNIHFNFGQNTENYGLSAVVPNRAYVSAGEIENVTTMGGFGEFIYKMSDLSDVALGLSFISSDAEDFNDPITGMAAFLQMKQQVADNFYLVPEVGMLTSDENNEGTMIYFGTQLRLDF